MAEELKADADKYKVQGVPDLVVFPHYASDAISKEGEFLSKLVEDMDVAILRDWEWYTGKEGQILEKAFINTSPFAPSGSNCLNFKLPVESSTLYL